MLTFLFFYDRCLHRKFKSLETLELSNWISDLAAPSEDDYPITQHITHGLKNLIISGLGNRHSNALHNILASSYHSLTHFDVTTDILRPKDVEVLDHFALQLIHFGLRKEDKTGYVRGWEHSLQIATLPKLTNAKTIILYNSHTQTSLENLLRGLSSSPGIQQLQIIIDDFESENEEAITSELVEFVKRSPQLRKLVITSPPITTHNEAKLLEETQVMAKERCCTFVWEEIGSKGTVRERYCLKCKKELSFAEFNLIEGVVVSFPSF